MAGYPPRTDRPPQKRSADATTPGCRFANGTRRLIEKENRVVIIATTEELDWMFDALGAAALCTGCPARSICKQTEEAEAAAGVPAYDRTSCGEMQRAAIQVKVETTAQNAQGDRNAGKE